MNAPQKKNRGTKRKFVLTAKIIDNAIAAAGHHGLLQVPTKHDAAIAAIKARRVA